MPRSVRVGVCGWLSVDLPARPCSPLGRARPAGQRRWRRLKCGAARSGRGTPGWDVVLVSGCHGLCGSGFVACCRLMSPPDRVTLFGTSTACRAEALAPIEVWCSPVRPWHPWLGCGSGFGVPRSVRVGVCGWLSVDVPARPCPLNGNKHGLPGRDVREWAEVGESGQAVAPLGGMWFWFRGATVCAGLWPVVRCGPRQTVFPFGTCTACRAEASSAGRSGGARSGRGGKWFWLRGAWV